MSFNIEIVGTGSKGNCIVLDDEIVIDVGLPFTTLKSKLLTASAILITHRHGDHLKLPNINQLVIERPWFVKYRVYTNQNVVDKIHETKNLTNVTIDENNIIGENSAFTIKGKSQTYKVKTFKLVHDVPNQGFVIENENGETLIYATDTETMEFAPNEKFDYILVEGNYDEDKINDDLDFELNFLNIFKQYLEDGLLSENYDNLSDDEILDLIATDMSETITEIQAKVFSMIDRATRNSRHLSVQKFEDFCRKHSKPNTIIYQLHESEGFGLRSDLSEEM